MSEKSFARIGYKNAQNKFQEVNVRAQDVVSTTGVSAETHITDADKHLTVEQTVAIAGAVQSSQIGETVAPLDANRKIPSEYIDITLTDCSKVIGNYTELLALSTEEAPLKTTVLVEDASGDSTVESGWALYIRKGESGTAEDWLKLQESEGLDVDFSQFAKESDKGVANGMATLGGDGYVPNSQLKTATTGEVGITQLSDDVDSEDSTKAATSKAVKAAYDNAAMLDTAYCTDEADMATKNLRPGALVLMAVQNDTVD